MPKKSQAALEFLTTYAWAFLVIMITIGTLYYFGIFNFSKFLPQKCVFTSQFECIDFSFSGDEIRFKLANNLGELIDVKSLSITNDVALPLNCKAPTLISGWKASEEKDFKFTDCKDGGFIAGERAEAKISMDYCAPATNNCPEHTVNGKITSIVNP
ncbi:hypothetical protein HYX01_01015 [Candidatus Woesearchaeota archaeon]|nr:hypothetical protein [Candidatus Woesearchaeota archaeon]